MHSPYTLHPQFIFRTPLLPLQAQLPKPEDLLELSKQNTFKEAIYLASPVLYTELIKWHNNELADAKAIQKLTVSLYKYYTRMQSRCTPYGLFAACSTGTWSDENTILLNGSNKRHTRLDMNYLCALAQQLNTHPALLPLLRFYPNNSLYAFGQTVRYVEYKYINNQRMHQISSVDDSDYLQLILNSAQTGARITELAACLVDDEITQAEAEGFIEELIQSQLLVSELEPAVTGDEFIYQLIASLKALDSNNETVATIINSLAIVQAQIATIDQQLGNDVGAYRTIYQHLKTLGAAIEENQLFQTDLYKTPAHASLDTAIQQQLLDTIDFLNRLSPANEHPDLKKFKENFYQQYEDSEVPLLEVLDTETGIGYTGKDITGVNSFLDDIRIPMAEEASMSIRWNKHQQLLHDQLTQAAKKGVYSVVFTDDILKDTNLATTALPDSVSISFRMIGEDKIYFNYAGGSSAANMLGRFAHGDTGIKHIIGDITAHEQARYSDKILAEIVHLPESRIGNILLRPVLRDYEIPYLGKSAMPAENQIQLQDLMVSVKNNQIVIRSKRLNKEVIPRLSTAHNYSSNALPVYQFLCDLQTQYFEKQAFSFHWGNLSDHYTFLPRAEYKNCILARAKWQLAKVDFDVLLDDKNPNYTTRIAEWRTKWNMPQHVVLADGDNELLINFDNEWSLKMLVSAIKKRSHIVLEEFLFNSDKLFVKDEQGNGYTHEFIAIGLATLLEKEQRSAIATTPTSSSLKEDQSETPRSFGIGSEWLYYKLYCGVKTADKLLAEAVRPLVDELLDLGLINGFFFIRYADPDLHIRVRFHISNPDNLGAMINRVYTYLHAYVEQGIITKMQTDTYRRELERYGFNSIDIAEAIFHIDSLATLQLVDSITGDEGEQIRWQFALRSVDEFLNSFKLSTDEKLKLLQQLKNGFIKEHSESKVFKVQLDTKFRNVRQQVTDILNRDQDATREIVPLIHLLEWKAAQLQPLADQVLALQSNNQLQVPLNDLLASYLHMMINRIFKARQRTFEMLMYDLLYRHYQSLAGREKNKNKNTVAAEL